MTIESLTIRPATRTDVAAVDALLARSYPALLKHDYPPSVLVTALPLISRARPGLVTCGTYYVALDGDDQVVGAGGWTRHGAAGEGRAGRMAQIRHVVTDHRRTRQGIGRKLMRYALDAAETAGVRVFDCQSTRTAVPFYESLGFRVIGPIEVGLAPGIVFPAIRMRRKI